MGRRRFEWGTYSGVLLGLSWDHINYPLYLTVNLPFIYFGVGLGKRDY